MTKDGIRPNPKKVKAIVDMPSPRNVKTLKSFLGMCNYYRKFIPRYAIITATLYDKLKDLGKFNCIG